MQHPASLIKIINSLKHHHVDVVIEKSRINITADLAKTNFSKISPLLNILLNKFEIFYLILIDGIPYCLMPDAVNHLIYNKKTGAAYRKNKDCLRCKYCAACPGWMNDNKRNIRPPAVNDAPREIVFEVTTKCNLNCPICFRSQGPAELPLGSIKTLIDECVDLGIKIVRFTGGEPLLYNNIEEALSYAKSKNLYVIVNTNATMLTQGLTKMLTTYADDLLVSLQGFNPASEKKLTQGSVDLKTKLQNIIQLNSRTPRVRLGTIISQTLINNFSKYLHLITSLGVRHWELYRPMHNAESGDFHIEPQDFLKLMKRIRLQRLHGNDIMIANPLPFCITEDMDLSRHVLVGAEFDDGHSRLVVDTEGFLKPSYCISKNLGQTITEAWENPFLKKIHSLDYLPQQCHNCFALKWCKGGSRYWAYIAHSNYFSCDPLMNPKP
jgi:radical SAM protein with 4Fe4S-binding SPASM domain